MLAIWIFALVLGIGGAALGSRQAVTYALNIADEIGVSRGLVGLTLVAIGTDLPEIANSISAALTGHGDVNVGDSTGSTLTQVTLVLAVLAFFMPTLATPTDDDGRALILPAGATTLVALGLIAWFVSDGTLGRIEGLSLIAIWAASMLTVGRAQNANHLVQQTTHGSIVGNVSWLMAWLGLVAAASTLVVMSFTEITDAMGVPELVASTVVLALGTSLPELVVDWTAIRRGAVALALGDLFGSSLVDATLSIGIGPSIRPTVVSSKGSISTLIVAVGVGAAMFVVLRKRRDTGRRMASELLAVYLICMAGILAFAA